MEEDGPPYAQGSPRMKKKKGKAGAAAATSPRGGGGVYTPPSGVGATPKASVTNVDRAAGQGHWTSLLKSEWRLGDGKRGGCVYVYQVYIVSYIFLRSTW